MHAELSRLEVMRQSNFGPHPFLNPQHVQDVGSLATTMTYSINPVQSHCVLKPLLLAIKFNK